jgi:hypothetical protein
MHRLIRPTLSARWISVPTCDEAVRADFDRALALMHHMMYVQSRGEFEAHRPT